MRAPRFTGRVTERRLLHNVYARAVGGQAQVVVISGEAGIGKSRLVAELASHLASEEHVV